MCSCNGRARAGLPAGRRSSDPCWCTCIADACFISASGPCCAGDGSEKVRNLYVPPRVQRRRADRLIFAARRRRSPPMCKLPGWYLAIRKCISRRDAVLIHMPASRRASIQMSAAVAPSQAKTAVQKSLSPPHLLRCKYIHLCQTVGSTGRRLRLI